jgi:hypothetical protein
LGLHGSTGDGCRLTPEEWQFVAILASVDDRREEITHRRKRHYCGNCVFLDLG